ncbi:outer envelope protein [Pseudoduganella namucuonensis]|uniref:Nucleoside-specific outer membrane channel protein Tsx n=1 Tax=Pseudoduganella namucuonensis TaxID=1035707 RepID=A0A1I7LWT6_9BURK|nr:outer envelope protein [Pseudoduganella namucuonensis]SFV14047.1 Nucleoside-specific outer membrane channel protein Tsx [Pseudoduganella namucuonensis]
MFKQTLARGAALALLATAACGAQAADWSDTSIGYRYGTKFAEPFNPVDIKKNIFNLTHASGYKYGSNFFNADMLFSDKNDPSSAGASSGAHEVYVLYRHTLDLGKVSGKDIKFAGVRGVGLTAGFDMNTKTDAGYNSKKRMLVVGPTLMVDVPGFLNVSLLALWESNAPYNTFSNTRTPRYDYDVHPMLNAAWAIPFNAGIPLSFEGFANFIASKGKNEFGGDTARETNIDMQIMYDMSGMVGAGKNTFKVGVEYQYWKNKFGNSDKGNPGATAKTPMIRAEYHF